MWVIGFPGQTLVPLKFTENCLSILSGMLTSQEAIKQKQFSLVRFETLFSMCRTWSLCLTQVIQGTLVDGSSAIAYTVCVTLTSSQSLSLTSEDGRKNGIGSNKDFFSAWVRSWTYSLCYTPRRGLSNGSQTSKRASKCNPWLLSQCLHPMSSCMYFTMGK